MLQTIHGDMKIILGVNDANNATGHIKWYGRSFTAL